MEELREQLEAAYDEVASDEVEESPEQEIVAEEAASDEADSDEQQISTDQSETETPETPTQEQLEAPQFWSDEYKAHFKTFSPEVQKYILEREKNTQSEFTRARQEAANLQREKQQYDAVFSQYSESIRQSGMSPTQYINALLTANEQLMRDPYNGLRAMAEALGVSPQQLIAEQQAAPNNNDPRLDALQRQVLEVQQWKAQQEQERQQREAEAQHQQYERLVSEIDTAINAKADDGSSKFPFLEREDVLPEVAALVGTYNKLTPNTPIPQLVERAYRKAIADNPTIQAEIEKQKAIKVQSENAAKVKAAKAAGKSISGSVSDDFDEDEDTTDLRAMLERRANKIGMK